MATVETIPIYKVGLIVVRDGTHVLLMQPEPDPAKPNYNPKVEPPFVPPRGSRRAYTAHGLEDIRTEEAAHRLRHARLEPTLETITREAEEEGGVPASALQQGELRMLGGREYRSGSSGPGVIVQWYVLPVSAQTAVSFDPKPKEARAVRWVTLDEMRALAAEGKAREGYVAVVEEVLRKLELGELRLVKRPA